MPSITIRFDEADYEVLKQQASKFKTSLNEAVRQTVKKGLLIDVPEISHQVQTNSAIETLLIVRQLAELQSPKITAEAHDEAKYWMKKLFSIDGLVV